MKRVLCDMDGVLVNSTETWLDEYRAISGDNLYPRDLKTYDFDRYAKHPKLVWKALSSGDVFRKSWPLFEAVSGFLHLGDLCDLYVVTYSHESVLDGHRAKIDWMAHHFPDFPEDQIIFTRHKHLVAADYIIEDNPAVLNKWLAAWPQGKAYIIDQPYNREFKHPRCKRVNTVLDVVMDIQEEL